MSAIEFTAPTGKTFSVQLYNATTNATIGSAITGVTDSVPSRYRVDTGSNIGIVYVVANAGNVRRAGYANLDNPAANGYSPLVDNAIDAVPSEVNVSVLPGRDRGLPQSNRGRITVAQNELITISRQVVDGNGNPLSLAGRTLQVVIQDARGTDIAVVTSITVSGTNNDTYSFAVPSQASARVGNFVYALNDTGASKAELAKGDWIVEARPLADS